MRYFLEKIVKIASLRLRLQALLGLRRLGSGYLPQTLCYYSFISLQFFISEPSSAKTFYYVVEKRAYFSLQTL